MRANGLSALGVLVASLSLGAAARADIPPGPGFVETCTVDKQAAQGKECVLCTGAYHGDPDACQTQYADSDYTFACRTSGASVWKEVWCKGKAAEAPTPEESKPEQEEPAAESAPKKSGCAGGESTGLAALLGALGLMIGWRRRGALQRL